MVLRRALEEGVLGIDRWIRVRGKGGQGNSGRFVSGYCRRGLEEERRWRRRCGKKEEKKDCGLRLEGLKRRGYEVRGVDEGEEVKVER